MGPPNRPNEDPYGLLDVSTIISCIRSYVTLIYLKDNCLSYQDTYIHTYIHQSYPSHLTVIVAILYYYIIFELIAFSFLFLYTILTYTILLQIICHYLDVCEHIIPHTPAHAHAHSSSSQGQGQSQGQNGGHGGQSSSSSTSQNNLDDAY